MFPDIALVTSGFGILQKRLSIRVLLLLNILVGRRIWGCNELDARSSRNVLTWAYIPCMDVYKYIQQSSCFYWVKITSTKIDSSFFGFINGKVSTSFIRMTLIN